MAMYTTVPGEVSINLIENVYQDQFEWAALVNDVAASIDNDTPKSVAKEQVGLLLSILGRDLVKLQRLVEIMQDKIERQSIWAATAPIKFYW